jgi:hypothetical protein
MKSSRSLPFNMWKYVECWSIWLAGSYFLLAVKTLSLKKGRECLMSLIYYIPSYVWVCILSTYLIYGNTSFNILTGSLPQVAELACHHVALCRVPPHSIAFFMSFSTKQFFSRWVVQLLKKVHSFYGTRRFIVMSTVLEGQTVEGCW